VKQKKGGLKKKFIAQKKSFT